MKTILLIAAVIGAGVSVAACTDDTYGGRRNVGYSNPYGDRDRDGVPNYRDRTNTRDSDRDGVPNSRDRQPSNPYRS